MSRAVQAQEPSMEDILASIRRIIADDAPSAAAQRLQANARPKEVPLAVKKPEPVAAKPAPAKPEPAAPAADAPQSQDDIDALFATDEPVAAVKDQGSSAKDDVFELTDAMRAPEPERKGAASSPSRPRLVESEEADLVFEEAKAQKEDPAELAAAAFEAPKPAPAPQPAAATRPFASSSASRPPSADAGRLISSHVDTAVSGSFSSLASLVLSRDARTLEDLVSEMLRPMLKGWLDENLPQIVERLVREEIERVARPGRR